MNDLNYYEWQSAGTDEPRDMQRDIHGTENRWAVIGPGYPDGWGWTVVDGENGDDLASGHVTDEPAARAAVDAWERLEYLRGELRGERISYGELAELQGLARYIEAGDVELLEPAGVPEFPEDTTDQETGS